MGGWVSAENASGHYQWAELLDPASSWTAALDDGSCTFFCYIWDAAAIVKDWQFWMDWVVVDQGDCEKMFKQGSEFKQTGKRR